MALGQTRVNAGFITLHGLVGLEKSVLDASVEK